MLSLVGEGKGKKDEQSDGRKGGNQDPKMGMGHLTFTSIPLNQRSVLVGD